MEALMKRVKLFIFGMIVSVMIVSGCSRNMNDKTKLDLPDTETKQIESLGNEQKVGENADENTTESAMPATGKKRFYVYADKGYFKNHFIPSGWMGDYGDIQISEGCKESPFSRQSCIRIGYTAQKKQNAGWAGIYWQEPANNWGNIPGGYDLTGATTLSFYARGEKGGELITEVKMGGIQAEYSDSTSASIGPIVLTPEWTKYEIDLTGEDLSNVIGGFAFVISEMENPDGAVFYIDEIMYE
jgi:hypothetical protein